MTTARYNSGPRIQRLLGMKLGSLKEGGRDGTLVVVSRDIARGVRATGIAPTLQRALEDWSNAAPRLADLMGDRQAVLWFLLGSSCCLALLGAMGHVWSFGVIRFLQVLCIAPVFPLAVAAIAARASGEAIGFINSSRIGAAFIGPVLATTLLAWMRPSLVYLVLAALGLAVVPLVARMERRSRRRAGPKEEGIA